MKKKDRKTLFDMIGMSSKLVELQFCVDFAKACQTEGFNNDEEVEEARQLIVELQDQLAHSTDRFLKSCLANAKDENRDLLKMVALYSERLENPNRPSIISDFVAPETWKEIADERVDSINDGACETVRGVRYIPEEVVWDMVRQGAEAVLYTQPICNILHYALDSWKQSLSQ